MSWRLKIDELGSPRDRILSAAGQLFYRHGIAGVSVDDVVAAAGSNKMTLYRRFGSKDGLIEAWLRATAASAQQKWGAIEETHADDAVARLHGLVDMMVAEIAEWMRGCPFGNSLAELSDPLHPAHAAIREYYEYQRAWLNRACREAGLERPEEVTDTLFFIIRGTSSGLAIDNAAEFAHRERRALNFVIESALRLKLE